MRWRRPDNNPAPRMRERLSSILVVAVGLFLFLGLPALRHADRIRALTGSPDAVSSATIEVPEQPEGLYYVVMNTARHAETIDAWEAFFLEQDADVIFEDLDCLVIRADAAGEALARRYEARLAEHQMRVRREDGLLALSRAQWGAFDVLILSAEFARGYRLDTIGAGADVRLIEVGDKVS